MKATNDFSTPTTMKVSTKISITSYTNKGMVRDNNEDNHCFCADLSDAQWHFFEHVEVENLSNKGALLILADGMGGANAGEVASEKAIEGVRLFFADAIKININWEIEGKNILFSAIKAAQDNITQYAKIHPETKGMGTTLVLSLVAGAKVYTAWSGDSRCYGWNVNTGLVMLSHDHSYVQELVDGGKLTMEQAFYHPDSNIITQSLGDTSHPPKPDFSVTNLQPGDRILLCSDGLSGMLLDNTIEQVLRENPDPTVCTKVLTDKANEAGGHDNITVILCDIISCPEQSENKKPHKGKSKLLRYSLFALAFIIIVLMAYIFGWQRAYMVGKPNPKNPLTVIDKPTDTSKKAGYEKQKTLVDQLEEKGPDETIIIKKTKSLQNPNNQGNAINLLRTQVQELCKIITDLGPDIVVTPDYISKVLKDFEENLKVEDDSIFVKAIDKSMNSNKEKLKIYNEKYREIIEKKYKKEYLQEVIEKIEESLIQLKEKKNK